MKDGAGHVYFLCNRENGRIYVGSTGMDNPWHRVGQHFYNLRSGLHKNELMQADFRVSPNAFAWGLLETIPGYPYCVVVRIAEQAYLYALDALAPSGYNIKPWPCGRKYGAAEFWFDLRHSGDRADRLEELRRQHYR
jgi:hypothetical protein